MCRAVALTIPTPDSCPTGTLVFNRPLIVLQWGIKPEYQGVTTFGCMCPIGKVLSYRAPDYAVECVDPPAPDGQTRVCNRPDDLTIVQFQWWDEIPYTDEDEDTRRAHHIRALSTGSQSTHRRGSTVDINPFHPFSDCWSQSDLCEGEAEGKIFDVASRSCVCEEYSEEVNGVCKVRCPPEDKPPPVCRGHAGVQMWAVLWPTGRE